MTLSVEEQAPMIGHLQRFPFIAEAICGTQIFCGDPDFGVGHFFRQTDVFVRFVEPVSANDCSTRCDPDQRWIECVSARLSIAIDQCLAIVVPLPTNTMTSGTLVLVQGIARSVG